MLQRCSKMWPQWKAVYEFWATLRVPAVSFQKYVPGLHSPNPPWISRTTGQQFWMTNPQINTAWHLARTFRDSSPEVVAAYKLYASCKQHDIWIFTSEVLSLWFQTLGMKFYELWHGNTKSVLPLIDQPSWPHEQWGDDPGSWYQLVELCAAEWRAVAEQWSVLIVPDMTDLDEVRRHLD